MERKKITFDSFIRHSRCHYHRYIDASEAVEWSIASVLPGMADCLPDISVSILFPI